MNKLQLISINSETPFSLDEVSEKLEIKIDLNEHDAIGNVLWPLTEWIGIHQNNIFITTSNVDEFFFEPNDFVNRVLTLFPVSKICATYYYSVPDQLGYAYFENGERIRTWYGIEDEEIYVDYGEKLDIERIEPTLDPDSQLEYQMIKNVTGNSFSELLRQEIRMYKLNRIKNGG